MTQLKITLEFDEQELGEDWINKDNLDLLLYSKNFTKRELLKVVSCKKINIIEVKPIKKTDFE